MEKSESVLDCENVQRAVRSGNVAFMAAVHALEEASATESLLHCMWYDSLYILFVIFHLYTFLFFYFLFSFLSLKYYYYY